MLLSLFSRTRARAVRGVQLYFGPGSVVVAAMHQNLAGIYYEQADALVLGGAPAPAELGAAFRAAFDRFSVRDADLGDAKKSDWPAYRASGARSLKEFERAFRPVACYGLNPSNAVVRAATPHRALAGVELSVAFNPLGPAQDIGRSLWRLVEATA